MPDSPLGKGLSALLSDDAVNDAEESYIPELKIEKVEPNPNQPRLDILAGGENIRQRAGADEPRGKRIRGRQGGGGDIHDDTAFAGGTLPNISGVSPTTSRPRVRNARTRTHHRILMMTPL